ncbi:MAG: diaminopimelate decarboxylase [Rhodobacteraceae bacterium]|nr:diaminopimelate decarboxylase [Paracoccaceae bacterium]
MTRGKMDPGPNPFCYRDGILTCEDVAADVIAEAVGTPCYIYAGNEITRNLKAYQDAFRDLPHLVCYALKANPSLAILSHLVRRGAGFDAVSGGEIAKALAAGADPARIVFAGVGKTGEEMHAALVAGIRQFNVESVPELKALDDIACSLGMVAPVALRVNPDVRAQTHRKITTGMAENKFGIDFANILEVWRMAGEMAHIRTQGLALHIGSQILSLEPYRAAFNRTAELVSNLRKQGETVESLDIGGGIGIAYQHEAGLPPAIADFARLVGETLGDLDCELIIEPGRSMIGPAGILIATVLYVKETADRRFLILDAALNDLLRPAMYDAWHDLIPFREADPESRWTPHDVVGPICESSDTFARDRLLPSLSAGDRVAFLHAGAYGASMASEYNCRPLVPEVMVSGDRFSQIRSRPTIEDMIKRESIPDWLSQDPDDPNEEP